MSEIGKFYTPDEVKEMYGGIVPAYQNAFAGEPWFEVSKCEDKADVKRCVGGFSSMPIGSTCEECGNCLIRTAYEKEELIEDFERYAKKFPLAWYLERNGKNGEISLASVVWVASPGDIAKEKYPDASYMEQWMKGAIGWGPVMWLDDIFADKSQKPSGNLSNFSRMCSGLAVEFDVWKLAFRTINPRLVTAAKRDFPSTQVYTRNQMVPDRRDFVVLDIPG